MTSTPFNPGLYFEASEVASEPSPLRSDVAGFLARTSRGPIGKPVRISGWRGYELIFGGLSEKADSPYAIRGYFENGGEIAWVVRMAGAKTKTAAASWPVGTFLAGDGWSADSPAGFCYQQYKITATSPGIWANDLNVSIKYNRIGLTNQPQINLTIRSGGQLLEYITGLALHPEQQDGVVFGGTPNGTVFPADGYTPPPTLAEQVAAKSNLIRIEPVGEKLEPAWDNQGPLTKEWQAIRLGGGGNPDRLGDESPTRLDYLAAGRSLNEMLEPSLISAPDLHQDLSDEAAGEVLKALISEAEQLHDRLVLVDLPDTFDGLKIKDPTAFTKWAHDLRTNLHPTERRAAALYHPQVIVRDSLGGLTRPQRTIPPSGHVAGLISRLDRERGAHHTPANALVENVVDVADAFDASAQSVLNSAHINLIRCVPARGLQVWGGRTMELETSSRFLAHRRFTHRLVRAIRRVAEPLVFDSNGPEIWLAMTQAITTILFEAYRSGALKGVRPDEAFRVRCDEITNPPEMRDIGRVLCEIEFTAAAPMEVILLRVSLTREGKLEVFQQ